MKKITFILFALIAGTTFAQTNTAQADVSADIVSPISVALKSGTLNFGKILKTNAGTVVLTPGGARNSETTGLIVESSAFSVPTFTVNAASGYAYSVTIPDVNLTNGTSQLEVKDFEHNLSSTEGAGLDVDFQVGATLNIESSDIDGSYTGTATVTVNYN